MTRDAILFLARAPLARVYAPEFPEPAWRKWTRRAVKVAFWLTLVPLFPVWLGLLVWQEGR